MFLRSGFEYHFSAPSTTTSTCNSRKRKSVDDELDERPLKRQDTTLVLQDEPSSSSHLTPLVAPPSSSNPSSPLSPSLSELPLVGEVSNSSVDTASLEDLSPQRDVEEEPAGNERGSRRVHFSNDVATYLFEVDDEPFKAAKYKYIDFLDYI
ncbi:hypothetical protein MAM1_0481d10695 [Mucor ambiguus]|uniref:Uncharacterized protein n=1 Tax=Mucor ambiguus TaxID=91626 RepID=A0A0C9N8W8_9FUNG|nr:hypothetical protein MAM1_0481d10695 [Mucor ambiguus]